jgi:PKD repeat protein/glutamine amidotransferase-like uncharacterized protein
MDTHKKFITTILTIMILFISSIPAHSSNRINSSITDYSINTTDVYGYIIQVNESQKYTVQKEIACLVNQLFEDNATVCWLKSDMTLLAKGLNDSDPVESIVFEKGCFIVGYTGNHSIDVNVTCTIFNYGLTCKSSAYKLMESILNLEAYVLKKPRVAIYDGKAVDQYSYYRSLEEAGFRHVFFITKDDILKDLTNDNYDIIMWGGQAGQFSDVINDNFNEKGMKVNNKINSFVKSGGGYIGSCYGAYKASSETRLIPGLPMGYFGFKINDKYKVHLIDDPVFRALPGGCGYTCDGLYGSDTTNGLSVRIVNQDCPVSFGLPEIIPKNEYIGGPMFLKKIFGNSNTESLAVIEKVDLEQWNKDAMMSYIFPVWRITPEWQKDRIVKRWVDFSIGKALWVTANYGKGKVVAFGSHPEFYGFENDRNPQRVIYNSVFYICSELQSNINLENYVSFSNIHAEINGPSEGPYGRYLLFSANVTNVSSAFSCCWDSDLNYRYRGYGLNAAFTFQEGFHKIVFCVADDNYVDVDIFEIKTLTEGMFVNCTDGIINGFVGEPVFLYANITNGYPPFSYKWDFDDKSNSTEADPGHVYSSIGYYRGYLGVTDSAGEYCYDSFKVLVNERDPCFTVNVETSPDLLRTGGNVTFTASVSSPGNYSYYFDFFDEQNYTSDWVEESVFSISRTFGGGPYRSVFVRVTNEFDDEYCVLKQFYLNSPPFVCYRCFPPLDSLVVGKCYEITFGVLEVDGEDCWFRVDYGDGYIDDNNETLSSFSDSGYLKMGVFNYSWDKPGEYLVRAKAIDIHGFESGWSMDYIVKVRRPSIFEIIEDFFDRILNFRNKIIK